MYRQTCISFMSAVLALLATAAEAATTLDIRVNASADDATQDAGGSMKLTDSQMKFEYQTWMGLRFNNVTIPKGATITAAYVTFRASASASPTTTPTIYGQDVSSANTFTTSSYNISGRTRTTASVSWSMSSWTSGQNYNSPSITAVVQEIVDRSDWSSGNSLAIVINTPTSGADRLTTSYNGSSSLAPLLHVEYTTNAHWKLDETSGTSAADATGSGHTGTVTGTATWASAVRNNGFSFNGATRIQASGLISSPTNFTVACWANVTASSTAGADAISLGDYITLRPHQVSGNGPTVTFYRGSSAYVQAQLASSSYVGAGWHHFAGTFDDASNSLKLYVDGVLVSTVTTTYSVSWSGLGTNTVLGSHGNGGTGYWLTGAIDDARVYDRALSASEIAELYGFVGHWKLNHTSGTTATDSTVFAQNGTVTGGASWTTDCGGNGAFDFDGSTKYISITNASHLQPTETLTIAAWIKADAWGTGTYVAPILRKGEANPNNYQLAVEDGYPALHLDGNDGFGYRGNTLLQTGRWYHLAGTWDGAVVRIYVNGVLDNTPATRTGTIGTDTRPLYIGGRSGTDLHDGQLRDVRLYNRALSASDILSLAGSAGRWQFSEGSGTVAADSSGAGNNATLSGGATWTTNCAGTPALLTNGSGGIAQTGTVFSPPDAGTVSFWVKPTSLPAATGRVMGLGGDWEVRQLSTGVVYFDLCGEAGSDFCTTTALSDTTRWYHVVATFDASNDSYAVYVDGTLQKSGTNANAMTQQTAAVLSFGTRTGSTEYWNGALRDVRVYNRRLCASEIAELYGLVGHWKLDESSGTTAADSSGLGNTGALTGTTTWMAAANNNGAQLIYTNGDDYFTIPNSSSLQDVQENNYTLAAWFKPLSVPPGSGSANDASYAIVIKTGWHLGLYYTSSRQFELDHYLSGYTWVGTGTWSNTYSANQFYHVAGVVNRIAGTAKIYVNGVLKNTATFTANGAAPEYGTAPWYIGIAAPGASSWKWPAHGILDDVRIYNRALCPTEIEAIFNSGSPFNGVKIIKWVEIQ